MPKFRVVINEEVVEGREYEIEAADAKEAAEIASSQYLVDDKLPKKKSAHVSDRWYDVFATEQVSHTKLGTLMPAWQFNQLDVEGDNDE